MPEESAFDKAMGKLDSGLDAEEEKEMLSLHVIMTREWLAEEYQKLTEHLNTVTSINDIDNAGSKYVFWLDLDHPIDALKDDITKLGLPGFYKLYLETEEESLLRWKMKLGTESTT